MQKDSGKSKDLPQDQTMLPHIQSWHPSRLKTALQNKRIGRKISLGVRKKR
jgi:hypothetical protein